MPANLLTVEDVARLCGVPTKSVYVWRSKGEGPPGFRVGKFVRYDPADVRAWLDQQRAAGQSPAPTWPLLRTRCGLAVGGPGARQALQAAHLQERPRSAPAAAPRPGTRAPLTADEDLDRQPMSERRRTT